MEAERQAPRDRCAQESARPGHRHNAAVERRASTRRGVHHIVRELTHIDEKEDLDGSVLMEK